MRNATAAAFLVLAPLSAAACLNDRDSDALAFEAKRLPIAAPARTREAPDIPGIVEVITGHFPRNPALYYQLRITRCQKELAVNPKQLALYDDISVAYDRLGKSGAALAWIEKKRPHISAKDTEALYRYYANIGTFRAHRWIREGAKPERIGELKQARNEIAEAVRLKLDAHFGREAMQLLAMEWLLDSRDKESLARFVSQKDSSTTLLGLAGLVVLGNAWESVDTFGALAGQLYQRNENKVALLSELRARELWRSGKRSLWTAAPEPPGYTVRPGRWKLISPGMRGLGVTNQSLVEEKFQELRTAADSWQAARTAFMEVRLKADRHPDTDPHFWDGYKESPAPTLDIPWHKEAGENFPNWFMWHGGWFYTLVVAPLSAVLLLALIRRRRAR